MPRKYKRKIGSRKYKDFSTENLEKALEKIVDCGWAINKAAKEFGISYGTVYNRYKGLHIKNPGGQKIFSEDEEKKIIQAIIKCSDWGFPLGITDVQMVTKNFLERRGRNVEKFTNNIPGRDWVDALLKRHSNTITQRLASNIKQARANISKETISVYFANLTETLSDDVPSSHIFNYDETNMADDPGRKRLLYRRGTKYPTNVVNFSKSATSVMFCGSASGVLLPPYIIYKAEHIWDRWTENGPKGKPCCTDRCCRDGSRYNRTKSGWMEASCFTDWFVSTFLPHATKLSGKKVLMGDNLSSHFTEEVLELCELNDILFVCLPPNTTHLTQPLDVCFFRPLKIAWRSVLTKWKVANPKYTTVKKEDFPKLLKTTLIEMENKEKNGLLKAIERDLKSGFEATGIYPLNPAKVLSKLPDTKTEIEEDFNETLVEYLKEKRYETLPKRGPPRKKQKLSVIPGKSVSAVRKSSDLESDVSDDLTQDMSEDENESSKNYDQEVDYIDANSENLKDGVFALVKVMSGRRKSVGYRYVCIVQEKLINGDYKMLGLISIDTTKKTFKVVDKDIFETSLNDIIAIIPQPEIQKSGDRLKYIFLNSIDVLEQ